MRVLRILFTVMFMTALFAIPAQAKATGEYRFLALVTQADPATPSAVQAQHAFQRLLPELLAAQRSGAILTYQPQFNSGILAIQFAAGMRGAAPVALQGLDTIKAAAALVPHPTSPAAKLGALLTPTFVLYQNESCFFGANLGANSHVVGVMSDTTGRAVTSFVGDADVLGGIYSCFDDSGPYSYVIPGYTVTFNVYDSTPTLLGTFSAKVPNITFSAFNSATSVITGSGPKNKSYQIQWWHSNLDAGKTSVNLVETGAIHANGKWSVDFGTQKFRGGDYFEMAVAQNPNFYFARYFDVPYIYCNPGSNYCSLAGFPSRSALLKITHAGITHTFTGQFNTTGWFSVNLVDSIGAPISLKAGDKIAGTGVPASLTLPILTAVPNYATDVVSGKAPASRYFNVWVKDIIAGYWSSKWVGSTAAGNYSADFTSIVTLSPGSPYTIEVDTIDKATGNEADMYKSVVP